MNRRLLAAIVSVLGVASAGSAHAYYLESRGTVTDPVRYDTAMPVTFRIGSLTGTNDDGELAAIRAAFQTWSDADCSGLSFVEGPRETEPEDPQHWIARPTERYVSVYFSDDPAFFSGPIAGFFAFGHDNMGGLIGGTVILNTRHHVWSTTGDASALDVQSVVTALIGRSLGITSNMAGNATYPRYAPGDISKRMLGADDLAAISFLYPEGAECGMTPPEMVCPAGMPGEPDCPPPIMMMMGDGGVIPGVDGGGTLRDAGMMGGVDAGGTIFRDAGPGPAEEEDGGCGCTAPGADRATTPEGMLALGAALAIGIAIVARRRRRD